MAFSFTHGGRVAEREYDDYLETKRANKAKAFNEYVKARADAGVSVDPLELDQVRLSIAGNDPFMASLIPAGAALEQLSTQANEAADKTRLGIQKEKLTLQDEMQKSFSSTIIDQHYGKTPEQIKQITLETYGPETGMRIWERYGSNVPQLLTSSFNKKVNELMSLPQMAYVKTEDDLVAIIPEAKFNPAVRKALLAKMASQNKEERKADAKTIAELGLNAGQAVGVNQQVYDTMAADIYAIAPKDVAEDQAFRQAIEMGETGYPQAAAVLAKSGYTLTEEQYYNDLSKRIDPFVRAYKGVELKADDAKYYEQALELASQEEKGYANRTKNYIELLMGSQSKYMDGDDIDQRIIAAINAVNADQSFYKSTDNIEKLVAFVRDEFDSDKKGFEAMAAYGKFMATVAPNLDTKTSFAAKKVREMRALREGDELPVGKDMKAFFKDASSKAINFYTEVIADVQADVTEYDGMNHDTAMSVYNSKVNEVADSIATLKSQRDALKQALANSNPRMLSNYNPADAMATIGVLENGIRILESIQVPKPDLSMSSSQQSRSQQDQIGWDGDFFRNRRPEPEPQPRTGRPINEGYRPGYAPRIDQAEPKFGERRSIPPRNRPRYGEVPQEPVDKMDYTVPPQIERPVEQPKPNSLYNPISYTTEQTKAEPSFLDNYLDTIADVESGGNPFARAATTTASGLFQFTKGTWESMVDRYGEAFNITYDDIFDPDAQRIMAQQLTMDNAKILVKKTGKVPNEKDLYLAHFLGPSNAAQVINNIGSGQIAAHLFPKAAKANKSIFYSDGLPVTIEQLYEKLGGKIQRRMNKKKNDGDDI